METNHPLDNAGPGTATEARCLTCGEILIITNDREDVLLIVMNHYEAEHGMTGNVMVLAEDKAGTGQGHFATYPAPYRCDICGAVAEPPWWVYVTPPTDEYEVQDPEWLVCDGCDPLVRANDMMTLVRRSLEQRALQHFRVHPSARDYMITSIGAFLRHLDADQIRREVTV